MKQPEQLKSLSERLVFRICVDILPTTGMLLGMALALVWLNG